MLLTHDGYDVFAPTDSGGNLRSVDNGQAQSWAVDMQLFVGAQSAETIKTADYTIQVADGFSTLSADKATAIAFTLPAAAAAFAAALRGGTWRVRVFNMGAGTLTVSPDGAETINGASSLTLDQWEGAELWTDGTDWRVSRAGSGTPDNASVTEPKLADSLLLKLAGVVTDRASLKALPTGRYNTVFLAEAGRQGVFVWSGGDVSSVLLSTAITSSSVDAGTNIITATDHDLCTGMAVFPTTAVDGLSANTLYYAIRVTDDTFKLATSFANAVAGTAFDLTGTTAISVKRHFDPTEGVYVCPSADISGASGAWTRVVMDGDFPITWFGACCDDITDDSLAWQAAVSFVVRDFWEFGPTVAGKSQPGRVVHPGGVSRINPVSPVLLRDYLRIVGRGSGVSMIRAHTTSGGSLFGQYFSATGDTGGRKTHIHVEGLRFIVTGANQVCIDAQHCGRGRITDCQFTTQDHADQWSNSNQSVASGTAGILLGTHDSVLVGGDIFKIDHCDFYWLTYGIRGGAGTDMRCPEAWSIEAVEISDCYRPIEMNDYGGARGLIANCVIQRWLSSVRAVDLTCRRAVVRDIYFESLDNTNRPIIIRSGSDHCVIDDASIINYSNVTGVSYVDSGTDTVIR